MEFDKASGQWRARVDRRIDGKRHRVSRLLPKGTSEAEALAIQERMVRDTLNHASIYGIGGEWAGYVARLTTTKGSWIDQTMAKCGHRARKRGARATLTREALIQILLASGGRCAVTGLLFRDTPLPGSATRPFRHSLDRIDSKGEYTADNVRIVCAGVNVAMMHWGEDVFAEMATGYVFRKYGILFNGEHSI